MKKPVIPFLILSASIALGAVDANAQSNAGNAQRGKQLFERNYCWSCHGYVGSGAATGPRLAQPHAV
jgi:mono/diheme cytochrome c family protein